MFLHLGQHAGGGWDSFMRRWIGERKREEESRLIWVKLRKSHLVQIGQMALNSHYIMLSDQTVKKILYYMGYDPKNSQSFQSFEMIIC